MVQAVVAVVVAAAYCCWFCCGCCRCRRPPPRRRCYCCYHRRGRCRRRYHCWAPRCSERDVPICRTIYCNPLKPSKNLQTVKQSSRGPPTSAWTSGASGMPSSGTAAPALQVQVHSAHVHEPLGLAGSFVGFKQGFIGLMIVVLHYP